MILEPSTHYRLGPSRNPGLLLAGLALGLVAAAPPAQDIGCTVVPPGVAGDWQLEVGHAKGRNEATALQLARAEARRLLAERLCRGVTPARCAAAERELLPWGSAFDREARSACAVAVVRTDVLRARDRELEALEAWAARTAADVRARVGAAPLWVPPPSLPGGCPAGRTGAALVGSLRAQLAGVTPGDPASAAVLQLDLAPSAAGLAVSPRLRLPGAPEVLLEGTAFAADLLGEGAVPACRPEAQVGVAGAGSDRLTLRVDTRDGVVCEGTDFQAHLAVSAPSRVKLFSVLRDGLTLVAWPAGGSDHVEREETVVLSSVALPELADERLIAVAVPEGRSFGPAEAWTGACKAPPFQASAFPEGTAFATVSYTVLTDGVGGCVGDPDLRDAMREALANLPACPSPR